VCLICDSFLFRGHDLSLLCGYWHIMAFPPSHDTPFRRTRRTHSYSGVLFGWLVLQAASAPAGSSVRMFGLLAVPAWASPFAALLVTHLIVPNASWTVRE
jgi:hypothetical protein